MPSVTMKNIVDAIDAPKAVADYSRHITRWSNLYTSVRTVTSLELANGTYQRDTRTLRMGKRSCEDWASLCWTENASVTAGDDGTLLAEIMDSHFGESFAPRFSEVLEREVFAQGNAALEVLVENATATGEDWTTARVTFDAAKVEVGFVPAACCIPMAWRRGKVTALAIASVYGKVCDIRIHSRYMDGRGWVIHNRRFEVGNDGKLINERSAAELFEAGIAPIVIIEAPDGGIVPPLFAMLKPAIANNIYGLDNLLPLGISVLENAEDQLRDCDLAYDQLYEDIYLKQAMVGIPDTMLRRERDSNGNDVLVPPQRDRKNLFVTLRDGNVAAGGGAAIWDYSPTLRVAGHIEALNAALSLFSESVGMGAERYRYRGETIATATQIISENSVLYRNRAKHLLGIRSALIDIATALLWCYANLLGTDLGAPLEDIDINVNVDDSVIEDDETRRARGMAKVQGGVMSLRRYLRDFEGLTDDELEAELAELQAKTPTLFGE